MVGYQFMGLGIYSIVWAKEKEINSYSNLNDMLRFVSLLEEMDLNGCGWKR